MMKDKNYYYIEQITCEVVACNMIKHNKSERCTLPDQTWQNS
jgi:hypothetical protein